ncbi:hypothetical protein IJ670_00285 [bacterium]|nr:hypothetical protein [bacterium]
MLLLFTSSAFAQNDVKEIKNLIKKHNQALKAQNTKEIRTYYDKSYLNSDGFNLDELVELLEKSYKAYSDIKYKAKIDSINVYDNWAIARLSDTTNAFVYTDNKKNDKKKAGYLTSKSIYNAYLKKNDGQWKFFYDDITMEESALKYGVARGMKMCLDSPVLIENGKEYNLSLKLEKPTTIIALASLVNEEIKYPTPDFKEKFRKYPADGQLERIVKANKNGLDEYAIASVGLTQIGINKEQTKAQVKIVGIAYLMKRINMQKKVNTL